MLDETTTSMEIVPSKYEANLISKKFRQEFVMDKVRKFIKRFIRVHNYTDAIFVRLMFIALPSYHIYILSCLLDEKFLLLLYLSFLVIAVDGVYVIWKQNV